MVDTRLIDRLERLSEEVGARQSKLILVVGKPNAGKTALLSALGERLGTAPLNVGAKLGARIAGLSQKQRHLQSTAILRELADESVEGDLLLVDNIELLFDRSLQLDPLELLKRHAHARRVVAVWPGELQGDVRSGRLTYADMGHPEHQDYSLAGVVLFEVQ